MFTRVQTHDQGLVPFLPWGGVRPDFRSGDPSALLDDSRGLDGVHPTGLPNELTDLFTRGLQGDMSPAAGENRRILEQMQQQLGLGSGLQNLSAHDLMQLLIMKALNNRENVQRGQRGNATGSLGQLLGNLAGNFARSTPSSWNRSGAPSTTAARRGGTPAAIPSGNVPGVPGNIGPVTPGKNGVPPGLRPNAARGAALVRKLFDFKGTIGGVGKRPNKSDHPHGNAIDVMTNKDMKKGQQIADFFRKNHAKLGVKYVIFNQRIASAKSGWQWRKMADRGSPTANHLDHPHISFY